MFRLALALGKSIREIEQFDAEELVEWMAFSAIETLAPVDSWLQHANQSHYMWQLAGCKKYKPIDFMPKRFIQPKMQSIDEQLIILRTMFGN